MKTDLFDYELPPELIAKYPPKERDGGRLLTLNPTTGRVTHERVNRLPDLLPAGALLVANDTRVIKARLRAFRPTGGAVEVLLVRLVESFGDRCNWNVLCRANKPVRIGDTLELDNVRAEVVNRDDSGGVTLCFDITSEKLLEYADRHGEVPLPPYIKRPVESSDENRYQTVYASRHGSVAAPTAGLHFTTELIQRVRAAGFEMETITLHVGPGTFKPVTATHVEDHEMDAEVFVISDLVVEKIIRAKDESRPVIAIGTTTTRALEGAFAARDRLRAGAGETNLFIAPGFEFRVIDGLFTNFHLPKSTLICLVSALGGRENVLTAYEEAVKERYRFYSYGDAMLVLPS